MKKNDVTMNIFSTMKDIFFNYEGLYDDNFEECSQLKIQGKHWVYIPRALLAIYDQ